VQDGEIVKMVSGVEDGDRPQACGEKLAKLRKAGCARTGIGKVCISSAGKWEWVSFAKDRKRVLFDFAH
jgi:hypothetical protein